MSLGEIKEKLYKREDNPELGKIEPGEFDAQSHLGEGGGNADFNNQAKEVWKDAEKFNIKESKPVRLGVYVFGGILFFLLLVLGIYAVNRSAFSESQISVEVLGPIEAKSGRLLSYEVVYKNNNRASLKNVSLKMVFPENFKPEDNPNFKSEGPVSGIFPLGDIPGKETGRVIFNGRAYSPKGALMYLKAELIYTPSNISTELVSRGQLGVNVVSSPLFVEILAPQNISSGDEVNYLVKYRNEGEENISGVRVRIDYPEGFVFSGSNPKFSEGNNIWYIGNLSKGQEGTIVATGKLEGDRDTVKNVKVQIGSSEGGNFVSFSEEYAVTKIVASPFSIFQTVNGVTNLVANTGDTLRFEVNFKNVGDVGLKEAIVSAKIDSPVLDYTTLEREGGFFDEANKTLTFKASDHPVLKSLSPGDGGTIKFSVKVKEVIPVSSANDKNFVISTLAKIDSPDVPTPVSMNKIVAGNKMDIRLNSKLILDVSGYYSDSNISNSGPIPPKAGEETTYTIYWRATNVSNDVTGAKVEAVLPTGVLMTGKTFPEGAKINYNERTNSLLWEIGNISSGTGILSEKKEIAFQVKVKPSPDQIGEKAPLLGKSIFTAKDSFTGENLRFEAEEKSTELREDSSVGDNYKVVN